MSAELELTRRDEPAHVQVQGDLAQSVARAIADDISRKMMLCATESSKTVEEMSQQQGISLSTCYRRINDLLENGLMFVDRIVVTRAGRYAKYRAGFSAFQIVTDSTGLRVEVVVNEAVAEKVRRKWVAMSDGVRAGAWSPSSFAF